MSLSYMRCCWPGWLTDQVKLNFPTHQYGFEYDVSNQTYRWNLFHRTYTSIVWYRCGISCDDSATVARWRFWSRVDTEIWWDQILVWLAAVFPLCDLDQRTLDFWCHGHHWSIRLVHQVGCQAEEKNKIAESQNKIRMSQKNLASTYVAICLHFFKHSSLISLKEIRYLPFVR